MSEHGTGGAGILVIGYGNELRGDDGIGPRVAEAVAARNHPGVRVRIVCQLVPELAAELAEARTVIFVDALMDPDGGATELAPLGAEGISDGIKGCRARKRTKDGWKIAQNAIGLTGHVTVPPTSCRTLPCRARRPTSLP